MSRPSLSLRLALVVVRLSARLAPGERRDRFLREWSADLHHAASHSRSPLLLALSSTPHAIALRRLARAPETLLQDARYALRSLAATPGFTLAAVLTLALGIGANSLIFSVVDSTLLRPMPFQDADRIVTLWRTVPSMQLMTSPRLDQVQQWRESIDGLEAIHLLDSNSYFVAGGEEPARLLGTRVSAGLFDFLGVAPAIGRPFTEREALEGAPVVILDHRLWVGRYGSDPDLIGRDIRINEAPYTVVGVMPEGFRLPSPFAESRLWLPLDEAGLDPRMGIMAIARLKPDVGVEAVDEELAALAAGAEGRDAEWIGQVRRPQDMLGDTTHTAIWSFQGAVGLVLLIACANVANLMLARGAVRRPEIAVRAALGASRGRLLRQLATESLALALAGGLLGLLLARQGVWLLRLLRPERMRHLDALRLDPLVVAATMGLAILAGLLFSLAPALQLRQTGISEALAGGSRAGESRGSRFARRGLVVIELALSTVLLVGAGLLIGSFVRAQQVDPGFEPEGLLRMSVLLPESAYPDQAQQREFWEALEARLASSLQGRAESFSLSTGLPTQSSILFGEITLEDIAPAEGQSQEQIAAVSQATSRYLETLGIPLLAGRFFTAEEARNTVGEDAAAEQPIVINERLARAWGDPESAIGRGLKFGEDGPWHRIVGVVGDVKAFGLISSMGQRQLYQPFAPQSSMWIAVRAEGDPLALAPLVREQVRALDPDVPAEEIGPVTDLLAETLAEPRFNAWLMGLFAGLALLLALVGVYGLLSYAVVQQTREIGIRMAIGASRGKVLRMVGTSAVRLLVIGLTVGVLAALWLMRMAESMLFELRATDPTIYVLVALVLLLTGLVATWVPARRATRVEPMTALRSD